MKILIGVLIIVAVLIIYMAVKNNIVPKNLGVKNGIFAPMPKSPNAVSSQTNIVEKKVEALAFQGDLNASKKRIIDIINNYGGANILVNEATYIHAVFKTAKVGFKDDVEFYFNSISKKIDYRSSSRVGYGDMGMNKNRYEKIKTMYYKK